MRCRVLGCVADVGPISMYDERPASHRFCAAHLDKVPAAFKERWDRATSQDELERVWQQAEDDFVFEAAR